MATRRMVDAEIWQDDFVGSLSFFERILWVGLFSTCADDQGRFQGNPAVIRSKVFPFDDLALSTVEAALVKFVTAGKIIAYQAEGKNLYQLVNWWQHQSPSWAMPSRYPAPDGWTDRVKYHKSQKEVILQNWDKPGGYSLPKPLGSDLHSSLPEPIEGEGVGDEEGEGEIGDGQPRLSALSVAFVNSTGIPELTGGVPAWMEALETMQKAGVEACDVEQAVSDLREKGYSIVRLRSIVNPAINAMQKRLARSPDPGAPQKITIDTSRGFAQ